MRYVNSFNHMFMNDVTCLHPTGSSRKDDFIGA